MGLGAYPKLSLADARDKVKILIADVAKDIDPIEERQAKRRNAVKAAQAITFKEAVEQFLMIKSAEFENSKHSAQWRSTLEEYAVKHIGTLKVAEITVHDVEKCLKPIWTAKTETASRVRGRIEAVLSWATAARHRSGENPARWKDNLEHMFPKPTKVRKVTHHAALPYAEVGGFMAELRKRDGISARALEFSILTAARSGEVRLATWEEIDFNAKVWTIPAKRMKARKEHRVALCDEAITLLRALPCIEGEDTVFPAPRGGAMSDMSLTAVLKRMNRSELTQHGFRSTFRDWAGETTAHPREVIEHALAHSLKDKAEAAYARGDLMAKRQRLMADWGKYCGIVRETVSEANATVVPLRAAVA